MADAVDRVGGAVNRTASSEPRVESPPGAPRRLDPRAPATIVNARRPLRKQSQQHSEASQLAARPTRLSQRVSGCSHPGDHPGGRRVQALAGGRGLAAHANCPEGVPAPHVRRAQPRPGAGDRGWPATCGGRAPAEGGPWGGGVSAGAEVRTLAGSPARRNTKGLSPGKHNGRLGGRARRVLRGAPARSALWP